jgi:hypothetical protein
LVECNTNSNGPSAVIKAGPLAGGN